MTVGGDIKGFVVAVEELDDVGWRWSVDDGRCYELVHGLVVGRLTGVVDKPSTTDVDSSRKESHPDRFLMSNALQSADEICAFKVLNQIR